MRSDWVLPDLHRRRAAEGRGRCQGASDPEAEALLHHSDRFDQPGRRGAGPVLRHRHHRAVAKMLGRDFIGIEREAAYREVAEKRIARIRKFDSEHRHHQGQSAEPRVPFGQVIERGMLRPAKSCFDEQPPQGQGPRRWQPDRQ